MAAPVSRLVTVFKALVSGLDQQMLSDGRILSCSSQHANIDKVSEAQLPFLLVKNGPLRTAEWTPYTYQCQWDLACTLKVKSEPGLADIVLQSTVDDLMGIVTRLRGLYVHSETGQVVPFSAKSFDLYRAGLLTSLAFRGGPFLTAMTPHPSTESAYGTAALTLHVEFIDDQDPTAAAFPGALGYATLFSVGTIERAVDESYPLGDPYKDFQFSIPVPAPSADTKSQGRYSGPDTTLPPGFTRNGPPWPSVGVPSVKDVDPRDLVREITLSPSPISLEVGNNSTVAAIAIHVGGWGEQVGANATWSSSNTAVATVSGGTVTAVASGTATITATYNGLSASETVTVTQPSYTTAVTEDSPIMWWRFNETAGSATFADASGKGVTGAEQSTVDTLYQQTALATEAGQFSIKSTSGGVGGAASANSSIVGATFSPTFTGAVSIEMWSTWTTFITMASNNNTLSLLGSGGQIFNVYPLNTGGDLQVSVSDGTTLLTPITATGALTTGVKAHIALTLSAGGTLKLYKNGAQVGSSANLATLFPNVTWHFDHIEFCRFPYFAGSVDEIAVYAAELSAGRIAVHYDAGR